LLLKMAKKRTTLAKNKHEHDLARERENDEKRQKRRKKAERRYQRACIESGSDAPSKESSAVAMQVDDSKDGRKAVSAFAAIRRRSIRKTNRKPAKMVKKMLKKQAKRKGMVRMHISYKPWHDGMWDMRCLHKLWLTVLTHASAFP